MGDKGKSNGVPPGNSEKGPSLNEHLSGENLEIVNFLKESRLFSHLPQNLLEQLLPLSHIETFSPGAEILKEGGANSSIFFLMTGTVGIYVEGEFILELERNGDIIGEMSCISDKPCSATVIAKTPVRLFNIKARDLGKYTDLSASMLQDTLYRLFSMILTEKLSITTYKAMQYESTHKKLLDEIAEHEQARAQLVKYQDSLEQMVDERTVELSEANRQLQQEIEIRKKTEQTLRESEVRSHHFFEGESDAIVLFDAQTRRLEDANQAALMLFKYDKKELLKLTIDDIVSAQSFQESDKNSGRRSGDGTLDVSWCHMQKGDGTVFPAEVTLGNYVSKGQKKIIESVHDLTERLQAKEKRKNLEYQLRQSQKLEAIGTLAGGIAHDFNNILGTILGFTELVIKKLPENSNEKKYLDEVYNSGERAADLVSQLLTFSRLEDLELKPLQLSVLVREVLKMMRATIPANIEIRQDLKSESSLIMANRTQIHQVIVNLFSNAEYTMRGKGGILEVKLVKARYIPDQWAKSGLKKGNSYLKLSVSDTGSGMNVQVKERIFDPFFTTKQIGEGTGLGLSVVHSIVKNHHGEITLKSKPNKGTTFHIFFPIVEGVSETEIEKISPPLKGNEHILVVEDELALSEYVEISLKSMGYQVTVINDSIKALKVFKALPDEFDLVFTDMAMPKMTGYDLSQKLLEIRPDLPIVLATGYSNSISEKKAKTAGIRKFLLKPVNMTTLTQAIRDSL